MLRSCNLPENDCKAVLSALQSGESNSRNVNHIQHFYYINVFVFIIAWLV